MRRHLLLCVAILVALTGAAGAQRKALMMFRSLFCKHDWYCYSFGSTEERAGRATASYLRETGSIFGLICRRCKKTRTRRVRGAVGVESRSRIQSVLNAATLALILAVLTMGGEVWAQGNGTPAHFQKWHVSDSTYRTRIGGEIANYPEIAGPDTTWAAIANDWVASGSIAENLTDILKTTVSVKGATKGQSVVRVTWGGVEYTVTQKLAKLVWVNTSTWNWVDVTGAPSWPTPTVDSNIVLWRGVFPGVDYRVRKRNATVEHGIFFKPAFLDSAVVLYNQRADSLDIALANVMTYTLSATCDDADSAIGTMNKRRLKQLGKYAFELSQQYVHFPGSDTLPQLRVKQRWERRGSVIVCAEYVMMSRLKQIHAAYPSATVWHNAVTQITGGADIEDASAKSGAPNDNYGPHNSLYILSGYYFQIRVKNVASNVGVGQTISAAVCSLYCYTNNTSGNVSAYRIFKPWREGTGIGTDGVTWNDWYYPDNEWTTGGCSNADDGGSDNSGDGTGADRKATAEATTNVADVSTWYGWSVTTGLAQGWYDGSINEEGLAFIYAAATVYFRSSDYGSGNNPHWTFTHSGVEDSDDNIIPLLDRRPIRGVGRGIGYNDEDSFETPVRARRSATGLSVRLCD